MPFSEEEMIGDLAWTMRETLMEMHPVSSSLGLLIMI
jgi:hypothetical protein